MKKIALVIVLLLLPIVVASEQKQFIVSSLRYEPVPAEPGNIVDVWLSVQNKRETVTDFKMNFAPEYPFSLIEQDTGVRSIPVLPALQDATLKFRVYVDLYARNEDYNMTWNYEYGEQGGIFEHQETVAVRSSDASITVVGYEIMPHPVRPGSNSTLVLKLKNNGNILVKDVDVKLDLDDSFSTFGTGNVQRIRRIDPYSEVELAYNLITSSDIEAMLYSFPIELTFRDERNNEYTETSSFAALVNAEPKLMVLMDNSELMKVNETGSISFKIVNNGAIDLKFLTLKLLDSEDYSIQSVAKTDYLGNLDADDFEISQFDVKANKENMDFMVEIEYADPYNNEFSQVYQVPNKIIRPGDRAGGTAIIFWVVLIIVLAIAGYWYYKRRKRK